MEQRNLIRYFIFTYLLFWLLLGVTGFLISVDVPELIQTIMKNVCAWTPTFVLLLMFRKLYPNISLREYFKYNFSGKTKSRYFVVVLLLQSAIFVGAVLAYFALNEIRLKSISFIGLVWGFWHLPLWILSGYSGLELLYYCFLSLVLILSLSVVITFFPPDCYH